MTQMTFVIIKDIFSVFLHFNNNALITLFSNKKNVAVSGAALIGRWHLLTFSKNLRSLFEGGANSRVTLNQSSTL